jgi:excisionase family DNA binding protein
MQEFTIQPRQHIVILENKFNQLVDKVWYNLATSGRTQMTDKWRTIEEIADYLQVSKEKIYKLSQRGKMPASKVGGQWRYDVKEVDGWVRRQRPGKQRNKDAYEE